jgi:acyl-CoA thioesterase FadM
MSSALASIRIAQRVEWMDTDAAGIYHWTTVARFGEAAEAALHNALGIAAETFGATPRLGVSLSFRRPLRFNDAAWVTLAVTSVGRSSVHYRLEVTGADGAEIAGGEIVTCLVEPGGGRSRPWPEHIRRALAEGGEQSPTQSAGPARR